ncbi:hypothetical protein A4H97_02870 [Niastella yeongjuensis]|uniref:Uncharacterized protein n=1 Tax=Niastella yeongjuensis TaxID=354355 RepID=A0A1V9EXE1_9BACT|nr:hypothetical protein A4H97_02870 [Niastella yeongjuensis]SEN17685.1 hypothetical protein SAMN05660816_00370 [Niastella yeongjuensis]
MDSTVRFILSLSIGIAVIIGIVRFRRIDQSYYPFIFNCIAALSVEILNRIWDVTDNRDAFTFVLNVFSYVDFFFFLWLFHNWGLFNRKKSTFIAIASVFFVIWLVTNIIFSNFINNNNYFFILYAFALIFFSVNTFNKMVVHERSSIFRNPKFWICLGVIIFYSFFIVVFTTGLSLFEHSMSKPFRAELWAISVYSNLLVNILYAVAVIWIPRKKSFTSLF